jgi:hypothetical protein
MRPDNAEIVRPDSDEEWMAFYSRIHAHKCVEGECRDTQEVPIYDKAGKLVTTIKQNVLHIAKCFMSIEAITKIDPHQTSVVELCPDSSCAKCNLWATIMGIDR